MKRHYNIPIFLPYAACPFRCVYCDQHLITSQVQVPQPHEIGAKIEQTLSTISENAEVEIAFFGGTFTALPWEQQEVYLKTVQPWLKMGRVQRIRLSTRPDCIERQNVERLKSYGVQVVELGIQSFDDAVLRASGRGYTSLEAQEACTLIKAMGLKLGVQLMPGLPQDTLEKSVASAEKTIDLEADMVRIYPTVVLKGTPLERMMERGLYCPLGLEEAVEVSKEMRIRFEMAQIPVIRLGLYIGEDLQDVQNVCGGAFHPALGELVEQRIFYEQTQLLLKNRPFADERLVFYVNQKDVSKFMGWRRENWQRLQQCCGAIRFHKEVCEERDWVGLGREGSTAPEVVLHRQDYLREKRAMEKEKSPCI